MIHKPNISLFMVSLVILSLFSCTEKTSSGSEKPTVTVTLFPLYDFAHRIAGDDFTVSLLLPPGVEPHNYEPSPRDIISISRTDVFIYTGSFMEPWVDDILSSVASRNDRRRIVDASSGVGLFSHTDDHDDGGEEGIDPHIWLDPVNARIMASGILAALIAVMPEKEDVLTSRYRELDASLEELDKRAQEVFAASASRTVLYGGHNVFGYFARRYGLTFVSPYEGFSSDAEPTPARIKNLIDLIRREGHTILFFEELTDPRIEKTIRDATGIELELLHGLHNVSARDIADGAGYVSLMQGNLDRLSRALEGR